MSVKRYTQKEIYQMLYNHEITKETAFRMLSSDPESTGDSSKEASDKKVLPVTLSHNIEEVKAAIIDIVAGNLHMPKEELRQEVSFKDFGVDSINGIEIIRDVNRHFGLNLDAVIIYDYANVLRLSELVLSEVLKIQQTHHELSFPADKLQPGQTDNFSVVQLRKGKVYEEDVHKKVTDIIALNLHLPKEELHHEVSFKDLGVDSINGIEIVRDINRTFGLNLDAVIIYDYSTITRLAGYVIQEIAKANSTLLELNTSPLSEKTVLSKTIENPALENNTSENSPDENSPSQNEDNLQIQLRIKEGYQEGLKNLKANVEEAPYSATGKIQLIPSEHISDKQNTLGVRERIRLSELTEAPITKGTITKGANAEEVNNKDLSVFLHNNFYQEDIAVIGISGRFPEADTVEEFWDNLKNEKDSIITVPKERWRVEDYYDSNPKTPCKSYSKVGGFIKEIDRFDPLFFNISPIEAIYMDPQQRLFLEEVWKALEDAGCSDRFLTDKKCGVFVGASQGDYAKILARNNCENSGEAFTGMATSILASRISYFLNLIGPSITIDTACSSSLAALHLACQSIRQKESEMAIVGGVRFMVTPDLHISTSKVEMLSKTGKCRAFDQSADGTIISEGVGAVILKPLKAAIEDGHSIYGIIKGSGINQDGKTNGITAPSMQSQIRLEAEVYEKAGINPADISYIEAHGTGTKLGDPIEVKALTHVFEKYTKEKRFCAIGSVKTNIGHTTTAAGITSVIKVLLGMKHKKIPATLHFKEANQHIGLFDTPFYVNNRTIDWEVKENKTRLAAVSAFGFSGTNAHVVLEEFIPVKAAAVSQSLPYYLITLSAKTKESYQQKVKDLLKWLQNNEEKPLLGDISYTLLAGRSHFNIRGAFLCESIPELSIKLKEIIERGDTSDYFIEYGNAKPINTDSMTKVFIDETLEYLQKSEILDKDEYKKKLLDAARLYVLNKITDYESILVKGSNQLIHLPTYPFLGDRYWVEEKEEIIQVPQRMEGSVDIIHPLLDNNKSNSEEAVFEKVFTGEEFYLKDHIVQKEKVLPAVAYLEMARAAASITKPHKGVVRLKNNYWMNAIKVNGAAYEMVNTEQQLSKISITLLPVTENENVLSYEVLSKEENGQEILHGRGIIEYGSLSLPATNEYLDINRMKSRCPNKMNGQECYDLFKQGGLNLGQSFQTIQYLYYNEEEVLAEVILPEHLKETFHKYLLHPSLMDGALETVIGMVSAKAVKGSVRLPYYIGEVDILGELTENCFSYARYTGRKKNGLQESDSYEVFILDEKGRILIKVKDFSLWVIEEKEQAIQNTDNKVGYYKYVWEKSDFGAKGDFLANLGEDLLVFDTDSELANRLLRKGKGRFHITLVKTGEEFIEDVQYPDSNLYEDGTYGNTGGNLYTISTYTINPNNKEDYIELFSKLYRKGCFPKSILYLWSKDGDYELESIVMQDFRLSIYPPLYITQALYSIVPGEKIKLFYLFYGNRVQFSPLNAAFGGFAKSLNLENTKYTVKSIQWDNSATAKEMDSLLLTELQDTSREDTEVMYTSDGRYVRRLKALLDINNTMEKTGFKTRGVYIISGGFGKLGLIVARYLAREYKARLCLTGRSPLNGLKASTIKELEAFGSEVLYIQADSSVLTEVEKVVAGVKERFQRIDGVFHCAGLTRDSYVKSKRAEDMEQVINPKVQGTIYLDLLTKEEPLDFFICFSSTAAITGNLGQADYAYGNSFMDYFALLREELNKKGLRYGKSLSINWPLWEEGGIKVPETTKELFAARGIESLKNSEGIKALLDGLKSEESQLVVLKGDTLKIHNLLGIKEDFSKQNTATKSAVSNTYAGNEIGKETIYEEVKNAVKDILRIKDKDIFPEKDMNEYGFNSLTFTELANKLNERYSLQINPSLFFEYSTLGGLSDYLYEEHYKHILAVHQENVKEEEKEILAAPAIPVTKPEELETRGAKREPIAIIGMSGTMPRSQDMSVFWENLVESKNLITEIPAERWQIEDLPDTISKWGGFMKEIDKFDPLFFGISPMEAELMDPQQRLFLQTVWETIEDAGYKPSDLSGSNTGLFVGVSTTDYRDVLQGNEIEALTSTGNSHCILTNRISFLLNLRGPSEPIDTACSSSLVAIHRGVEAIYSGDCEMAIVGGINVIASPTLHISFSKAGMLSPDGGCKTFDEKANGYVRGEGSGAILLKPLGQAQKDGDTIYALIKGTAINHGGRAASLTAPNPNAQAEVIMKAFDKAGFLPETVSYLEAHGTGTQLGDPIEINALKKAFQEMSKKSNSGFEGEGYCGIGSVKTNIGHLETAAGIASVLKVLLAIKHKKLPGLSGFSVQNPYIDLSHSPFYLITETREWKSLSDAYGNVMPRRAGISSFGFGGVNAHIALEEYTCEDIKEEGLTELPKSLIMVLSAKNKTRLTEYADKMLVFLKGEYHKKNQLDNNGFAYTLQTGREEFEERLAIVFSEDQDLIQKLESYLSGKLNISGLYQSRVNPSGRQDNMLMENGEKAIAKEPLKTFDMELLASLWVTGTKIDWKHLYEGKQLQRLPLPTYPFEKRRLWKNRGINKINENKEERDSSYIAAYKKSIKVATEKEEKENFIDDYFYLPEWKEAPFPPVEPSSEMKQDSKKVLILIPEKHQKLCEGLMEYYGKDAVHLIVLGEEYKRINKNTWQTAVFNENGISNCLKETDKMDIIYFFGGVSEEIFQEKDKSNLNALDFTQQQGVLSLFRLIKALVEQGFDNQNLHLKIITNNVHSLKKEAVIPAAGSVLGFAKSMAKEFAYWKTTCLDIDIDEWHKEGQFLTKVFIGEPAGKNGEEVLVREKRRYVQRLVPTRIDKGEKTPFQKEGVYLILGGGGGIGLEFSKYLASEVKAKIALIGRSDLTAEKKAKIEEIEKLGGRILYLKADATDLDSMREAVIKVKQQFGAIHGVVHSAIVMKDRAIRNMTERDLMEALEPKVKGSAVLYEAVKGENLDFILFFSSIQSFAGNGGQANYAAACGFKDSFAAYLKSTGKLPVKIINWGYWGTVGVASSKEHNKIMASKGMLSISPEEGMEAIKRIMSNAEIGQAVVLKAKPFLLEQTDVIEYKVSAAGFEKPSEPQNSLVHTEELALSHIKSCIINCLSEVLKVEDYEIDTSSPFSDYGVDSITGMELINCMNEKFNIVLKTTILFDYSNVEELAAYIQEEFGTHSSENLNILKPEQLSDTKKADVAEPDTQMEALMLLAEGKLNVEDVMDMMV
jgi:polyketide synthase PksN